MKRMHFALILWLALTFVGAQLMGAHLHLCFDGSEPPATLHVADTDHHADHHTSDAHDDLDVSAFGEAIAKLGQLQLDLPVILLAVLLLPLLLGGRHGLPAERPRPFVSPPLFLRPPLRGPPLIAS